MKAIHKILVANILVMQALANAETVDLSIQYTAPSGQSVFVTAQHPKFGDGDVTRAVKLSQHDRSTWSLKAELPPDTELTFTYLLRHDSPGRLSDPKNGSVIRTVKKATKRTDVAPQQITVIQDGHIADVRMTSKHGANVTVPLTRTVYQGRTQFVGTIDHVYRANGYDMEVFVDGTPALTDSVPTRCHPAPLFYQGGQAYHYRPSTETSAPRWVEFDFTPSGFRTRRVTVLLPRGYDQDTNRRYPVVYAEDGIYAFSQHRESPSWDIDNAIITMTRRGELPEVIVVAIDNTQDRSAEYTPEYASFDGTNGRGDEYITAVRDGLLPVINRWYRTETAPSKNLHVGRSLGGLLGYHIARNHEGTWGSVIAMSTVFYVGLDRNLAFADLPKDQWGRLYLDSGTAGEHDDDYGSNVLVRDRLIQNGHVLGSSFHYTVGNNHQHNDDAWRSRYPEAMRWWAAPLLDEIASNVSSMSDPYVIAQQ